VRPGRGDVRRADRGDGADARALPRATASLHGGADGVGPAHGGHRRAIALDRRPAATASQSPERLSLRGPLRVRRRPLPPRVPSNHAVGPAHEAACWRIEPSPPSR
jgi:hypothetical protein